jgi:nitrite reductase/ring-hydroxylating ferredoxin subunit
VADFVLAIAMSELPPGSCREVTVEGRSLALYNVAGRVYATSNSCLHRGGPLGQGALDGCTVFCPWHAWAFDVRTECAPTTRIYGSPPTR